MLRRDRCVWTLSHTNAESEPHLCVVTQNLKKRVPMVMYNSKRASRFGELRKDALSEAGICQ